MKSRTEVLLELWKESRTRFSNQLPHLLEEDLKKKLLPSPNSVGFIIRHIGDVELLFAKNVFGATSNWLYEIALNEEVLNKKKPM